MTGRIAALARHPVKGFTPEPLAQVELSAGAPFPHDRLYALECGPSGFDSDHPAHVSKMKLAVLAPLPALARVATRYDDATGRWRATAPDMPPFEGVLTSPADRAAFAAWLQTFLASTAPGEARGPLAMLAADGHRFFDDTTGAVSLLNLASVNALGMRMGAHLDPARFRANVMVEGWAAWAETGLPEGTRLRLGGVELASVKPIRRCVAVHVDPATGVRDLDVSAALHDHYGHMDCGLYLQVVAGGAMAIGDPAELSA